MKATTNTKQDEPQSWSLPSEGKLFKFASAGDSQVLSYFMQTNHKHDKYVWEIIPNGNVSAIILLLLHTEKEKK